MKLPQFGNRFKWNYVALAFCLPMTIFLVLMFITSVTPFGSQTFLYSDNFHQYYPFFRQFRQALRSGESLQWTWSVGAGMDYLGLISYYLASPLNLLSVLLPESWTLAYFTLLVPIKLSLASGFFAIMLKKLYGADDLSLPLFGSFYGLCAWALGYQWNIMWLDSFALLPLVALGAVLLLRDKKYILYTISLFLAVFSNYYVGFFVCIFVFFLFFCFEICRWKSFGRFCGDLFRIGIFTILAIGMTAILELPTLASLQTTYSSVNQFPSGFDLNIVSPEQEEAAKTAWTAYKAAKADGSATILLYLKAVIAIIPPVLSGMAQVAGHIGGGMSPTFMDGLPNLHCGVVSIGLVFLFLSAKEIRLRDKLCSLALLLFFTLSFLFRQLDYVWHGFHFPNQIPYRFSFLFSFVMLYMAYRAWLCRGSFTLKQLLLAGALSLVLLAVSRENWDDMLYWVYNLVFLGLYVLIGVYANPALDRPLSRKAAPESTESPSEIAEIQPQKLRNLPSLPARQSRAALALTLCMVTELVLQVVLFASNFYIYDYDYPKKEKDAAALFAAIEELDGKESLFYRTEVTHAQTLNDGALNGYNGISTFSSSANVATTEFMQCLGAAAYNSWNRYCYEESSPVSNLFLNLKYLVERDYDREGNTYFDVRHSYKGLTLLENNAYLPLGFLAESGLTDVAFSTGNRSFGFQNSLFRAATGVSESVWYTLPTKEITVTATGDVSILKEPTSGYCKFSTGSGSGELVYTFTPSREGFLCLDLNLYKQKKKDFSVLLNGELLYREGYSLPQMLAVGNVQPGDTVEVRIPTVSNLDSTSVSITAAVLNEGRYREGYAVLAASTLHLTEFSTTRVAGTISCNRDGLLYTSIPQNGNWVAYVDGEKVETVLVGDCMVSVPLTEGDHEVVFAYENRAFALGRTISIICALCFAGITAADYWMKKRKKSE